MADGISDFSISDMSGTTQDYTPWSDVATTAPVTSWGDLTGGAAAMPDYSQPTSSTLPTDWSQYYQPSSNIGEASSSGLGGQGTWLQGIDANTLASAGYTPQEIQQITSGMTTGTAGAGATTPVQDTGTLANLTKAISGLTSGKTGAGQTLSNIGGALGITGSNVLPIGLLGAAGLSQLSAAKGGTASPYTAQLAAAGQPATDVSKQLLAQYQSGKLNPVDASQISDWEKGQKAALDQYYSQAGLSDSDMHIKAVGDVSAKAEAMRSQALQSVLTQGLNALGVGYGPLKDAATAAAASDKGLADAQAQFFQMMAQMYGMTGSSQAPTDTTSTDTTTTAGA